MKNRSNQILLRFFCAVFAFLTLLFVPFSAFSMNLDYLEPEKWVANKNVTAVDLSGKKALGNELSGVFCYYVDKSMCIYTYFSIDETSFFEETDELKNQVEIRFDFLMPEEVYSLSVDRDGISENSGEEEKRIFTACPNYNFDKNEYIAAVQYNGKDPECLVNIALSVNGHNYKIKDKILMELPTTTTTTKPAKEKTTKPKTTKKKAAKKTKTAAKSAKSTTKRNTRATRATRKGAAGNALDFEEPDETEAESETDTQPAGKAVNGERELSLFGRYLLLTLPVLAILAIFFFFIAAKKSSRKNDEKQL